jgi:outer membrane protein assembly factor BamE (lipoprotein component of BamABCDE complex)
LAGCIVIPTPPHRTDQTTRGNVDKHSVETVKPGESLADVLLRLGEPDEVSLDGRQVAYRWDRTWAYWFVGGGNAAAGGAFTRSRALVIDLDDRNRVVAAAVPADNLASRPKSAEVFTPEHGGRNTSKAAAALRDGSEFNRYRGESVEFRAECLLYPGFDGTELAKRNYFQNLGRYPQSRLGGEMVATTAGLHFKRAGALGTDPPELSFRFADLASLECARAGFQEWVVVKQGTNAPLSFTLYHAGGGNKARTAELHERIRSLWQSARKQP